MTDLESLEKAKTCLYKLANGVDPFTDQPIPNDALLNDVRISRCFFYVSDVLQTVYEEKCAASPAGVPATPAGFANEPSDALPNGSNDLLFEISERSLSATALASRLNQLIDRSVIHRFTYGSLTTWLLSLGLLQECDPSDGRPARRPTEDGEDLGIHLEKRTHPKGDYILVTYSASAQQFFLDHFNELLVFQQENFPLVPGAQPLNQGYPWDPAQDDLLIRLFEQELPLSQIASTLMRSTGGVKRRLRRLGFIPPRSGM
jgi:hypothetical protein